MVLDADGHAELTRTLGALLQRGHHHIPLRRIAGGRIFICGEDAHQIAAQIARQPGQLSDVMNLDFAVRHFAVLQVAREIVVTGNAQVAQIAFLEMLAQLRAFLRAIIEIERCGRLAMSITPS